jgi:uncharacterized protein (TIGR02246 family)
LRASIRFAGLALAAALALATGRSLAAEDDLTAATRLIDQVDADWLGAMKAKDADRLAASYAPDGLFVLPGGDVIVGRAAIVAFYKNRLSHIAQVLDGGIHRDGLVKGADGLLYEWGHGGATSVNDMGRTATSDGPYLTVWKRDPQAGWCIIRNLVF